MGEKNTITISVKSLLLFIAVVIICIMGYFLYNMSNEKQIAIAEKESLETKVASFENTVNSTTENENKILNTTEDNSNLVSSDLSTKKEENISENTEEITSDCKEVLNKFLEISCISGYSPESILEHISVSGKVKNENITINGYDSWYATTVKYVDFKNAMTQYMTEDMLSSFFVYENYNGNLAIMGAGASGYEKKVKEMKLVSNSNDTYKFTGKCVYTEMSNNKEYDFSATLKKENGKYVVSELEENL